MPRIFTCGSSGRRTKFTYKGNIDKGVTLKFPSGDIVISPGIFKAAIEQFKGKIIKGGFSMTNPPPDGFGVWVQNQSKTLNKKPLTPRHGSFIAAILHKEGYVQCNLDNNSVILKFETKEDIKLNPSDYEYLDNNFPNAGWMWEFIRRSKPYRNKYNKIKELSENVRLTKTSKEFVFNRYELSKSSDDNGLHKQLIDLEKECFVRPIVIRKKNNWKGFLSIYADSSTYIYKSKKYLGNLHVGIPNPDIKYCDFIEYKPFIKGATSVAHYKFVREELDSSENDLDDQSLSRIMKNSLTIEKLQDTIYLGISISANYNDIKREIDDILWRTIAHKQFKARRKKWKSYLMTYDLYAMGLKDVSAISTKLSELFEEDNELCKKFSSERNISNYYKEACNLINGEYKNHLYLAK